MPIRWSRRGWTRRSAAQPDFRIIEHRLADDVPLPDVATVAVTDYDGGTRLLAARRRGRCRVLILTDDDERSEHSSRAWSSASAVTCRSSSGVDSVVHAVRCIHNGGTAIAPNVMTKMAMSLRSRPLTEREIEVLRLIMQGLPDKAIARRLERSVGTAKSHVKAILMKLDASSRGRGGRASRGAEGWCPRNHWRCLRHDLHRRGRRAAAQFGLQPSARRAWAARGRGRNSVPDPDLTHPDTAELLVSAVRTAVGARERYERLTAREREVLAAGRERAC